MYLKLIHTQLIFILFSFHFLSLPSSLNAEIKFKEHLIKDKLAYPYGLSSGDMNKDGWPDVICADARAGRVYVFANQGKNKFKEHVIIEKPGFWFERNRTYDINGDGYLDIVVVVNNRRAVAWLENPKGNLNRKWKEHLITDRLTGAYDVAIADINNDGRPDIAASSWREGNRFMLYVTTPSSQGLKWKDIIISEDLMDTRMVQWVDIDHDGDLDLFGTVLKDNLILWFEQVTLYTWKRHIIDDTLHRPAHGQVSDINGDGKWDFVVASGLTDDKTQKGSVVLYTSQKGKWVRTEEFEQLFGFEALSADFNNDGQPEIIATSSSKDGQIVLYKKTKKWGAHVLKRPWPNANSVLVLDSDQDGDIDFFATADYHSHELRLWENLHPLQN